MLAEASANILQRLLTLAECSANILQRLLTLAERQANILQRLPTFICNVYQRWLNVQPTFATFVNVGWMFSQHLQRLSTLAECSANICNVCQHWLNVVLSGSDMCICLCKNVRMHIIHRAHVAGTYTRLTHVTKACSLPRNSRPTLPLFLSPSPPLSLFSLSSLSLSACACFVNLFNTDNHDVQNVHAQTFAYSRTRASCWHVRMHVCSARTHSSSKWCVRTCT